MCWTFWGEKVLETSEIKSPIFDINKIKFIDGSLTTTIENIVRPITYNYELGKLATKRNTMDFNHFGNTLKIKCAENQTVLSELEHMKLNIYNKIEYYSAYKLICTELKNNW